MAGWVPRMDPRTVTIQFNDNINNRNLVGLAGLMTDDHVFIDTAGQSIHGKEECLRAWQGFFASFSDYKNIFDRHIAGEHTVTVVGRSSCSDARLDGPALWSAKVRHDKIFEWRIYENTPHNRRELGVE
jgi:ketosteroid isomerase-like protein